MYGDGVSSSSSLVTSKWGNVTGTVIGSPSLLNTTVSFSIAGSDPLRFTVSDGTLSTSNDDIITVAATQPCDGTISGIRTVGSQCFRRRCTFRNQVKLDDMNMGFDLTSTPYSIMWNTTLYSNFCHIFSAIALNAAADLGTQCI